MFVRVAAAEERLITFALLAAARVNLKRPANITAGMEWRVEDDKMFGKAWETLKAVRLKVIDMSKR
jgi:hypothetical protein